MSEKHTQALTKDKHKVKNVIRVHVRGTNIKTHSNVAVLIFDLLGNLPLPRPIQPSIPECLCLFYLADGGNKNQRTIPTRSGNIPGNAWRDAQRPPSIIESSLEGRLGGGYG